MANILQLKALFQNIYYCHFFIYSVLLLGEVSEKLMKDELWKEVYKLSDANWGKNYPFRESGSIFQKLGLFFFSEHNDLTVL